VCYNSSNLAFALKNTGVGLPETVNTTVISDNLLGGSVRFLQESPCAYIQQKSALGNAKKKKINDVSDKLR
jgi:hypothetical protein